MDLWSLYVTKLEVKLVEKENRQRATSWMDDGDDMNNLAPVSSESLGEDLSGDEGVTSASNATSQRYRSDIEELKKYPTLLVSPLFSYLAMLVLKLPITLSDIYSYFQGYAN
jgi:hypothetical protein